MSGFQEARKATRIDKKGVLRRRDETLYFMYDGKTGDIIGCFFGIKRVIRFLIEECDYLVFVENDTYDRRMRDLRYRINYACRNTNVYVGGYLWSYEKRDNYYDGINDKNQRHNFYGRRIN